MMAIAKHQQMALSKKGLPPKLLTSSAGQPSKFNRENDNDIYIYILYIYI